MKTQLAAVLLTFSLSAPGFAQDARYPSLIGDWQGSYHCAQGHTGLTLTINAQSGKTFSGLFHFYSLPDNRTVPEGCFTVSGTFLAPHKVVINGGTWITHPQDYVTVDLDGVVTNGTSAPVIGGRVELPGEYRDMHLCSTFVVKKATSVPSVDRTCQSNISSR